MARHIDDAQMERRQSETGEADVDGDAALFFFGQTITIGAGQRLDKRGLAVIDVTGRTQDQIARHGIRIPVIDDVAASSLLYGNSKADRSLPCLQKKACIDDPMMVVKSWQNSVTKS